MKILKKYDYPSYIVFQDSLKTFSLLSFLIFRILKCILITKQQETTKEIGEIVWQPRSPNMTSIERSNKCVHVWCLKLFFLAFDFCRFCVVIRVFSSPPHRPMTSDLEGFLYQILSIALFSYLNSWERWCSKMMQHTWHWGNR